jgi:head-tail adaptor
MALNVPTIGKLRERIRIDKQVIVPDSMGGQPVTWQPYVTIWAQVVPIPGGPGEQVEGGGLAAVATYQFVVRRRADLSEVQRIVWPVDPMTGADIPASLQFNVRSVDLPPSLEMYMAIEAEAGVAI